MTNDIQQPTAAEIRAYEAKAHQLRAQAMLTGIKAVVAFVKSIAHRAVEAFTRPVHA